MPTSYTSPIYEGKQISLDEFIWRCARAFGGFVLQRDESLEAPLRFETAPDVAHADRVLAEQRERLALLRRMTHAEAQVVCAEERARSLAVAASTAASSAERAARYDAMTALVQAWKPPSAEHEGLKEFMLEQLGQSRAHDCADPYGPGPARTAERWLADEITRVEESIASYEDSRARTIKAFKARKLWVDTLAAAVPPPARSAP